MEGSEVDPDGESQDPGLAEAPTGAPPVSEEDESVPETDDQPQGSPETEGEDIEPEGGGAADTEGTPDASGGSI
jgi:hypothetical protein